MSPASRLDQRLVEQGLVASRDRATRLIRAGKVLVEERVVDKPGAKVAETAQVRLLEPDHPYVSRGGLKLEGALDRLALDPSGAVAADLGASTGGFTDCLLQRGAARVHAVDVGYGLLDFRLRSDDRVVVHERINARHLTREDLGEAVDLVVGDLSFISLRLILPAMARILRPGAAALVLVKPQFELERKSVGKGGIVKDPTLHQEAVRRVSATARELGFRPEADCPSPIRGQKGNQEFFLLLRWNQDPDPDQRGRLPGLPPVDVQGGK